MVVELISVGTELLLGNIVNTNAKYLSEQCAKLGFDVFYQTVVGDNNERLSGCVRLALSRSDIIIMTGGLGPTEDDLTKETVSSVLGLALKEDKDVKESIKMFFSKFPGRKITENNWKQALVPETAMVLENKNGTAPGLMIEKDGKTVVMLPGPPVEMKAVFDDIVLPLLKNKSDNIIYSREVKICGIGESEVESTIKDIIDVQSNPTIAPYAKLGEVVLRITAKAETEDIALKLINPVIEELQKRFTDNIYSTDGSTLEQTVVRLLKENDLVITTAESCTGGLLSARIINVPGASDVFSEGYVTYSNNAKRKNLDVNKTTLQKYTDVSAETAKEMAKGCLFAANADIAVSVTGIAGPSGGSADKPVGSVYIACFMDDHAVVKECHFSGYREKIRDLSVVNALDLVRRCILERKKRV